MPQLVARRRVALLAAPVDLSDWGAASRFFGTISLHWLQLGRLVAPQLKVGAWLPDLRSRQCLAPGRCGAECLPCVLSECDRTFALEEAISTGAISPPEISGATCDGCGAPLLKQHGAGRPVRWCSAYRCQRTKRDGGRSRTAEQARRLQARRSAGRAPQIAGNGPPAGVRVQGVLL